MPPTACLGSVVAVCGRIVSTGAGVHSVADFFRADLGGSRFECVDLSGATCGAGLGSACSIRRAGTGTTAPCLSANPGGARRSAAGSTRWSSATVTRARRTPCRPPTGDYGAAIAWPRVGLATFQIVQFWNDDRAFHGGPRVSRLDRADHPT